jgi:hypothetical protein
VGGKLCETTGSKRCCDQIISDFGDVAILDSQVFQQIALKVIAEVQERFHETNPTNLQRGKDNPHECLDFPWMMVATIIERKIMSKVSESLIKAQNGKVS